MTQDLSRANDDAGGIEPVAETVSTEATVALSDTLDPTEIADSAHADERTQTFTGRRLSAVMSALAVLAVSMAVLANWLFTPIEPGFVEATVKTGDTLHVPSLDLDKPAITMLPESILTYETIARHAVPGQGNRSAEAIYVTLNMELDIQVPVSVYCRVDGFESAAAAERRAEGIKARYPKGRVEERVGNGPTVASVGYSENEGAWVAVWTRGTHTVMVKSAFKDKIPFTKRKFLVNLGRPVMKAVDTFQRTSRQGIEL